MSGYIDCFSENHVKDNPQKNLEIKKKWYTKRHCYLIVVIVLI